MTKFHSYSPFGALSALATAVDDRWPPFPTPRQAIHSPYLYQAQRRYRMLLSNDGCLSVKRDPANNASTVVHHEDGIRPVRCNPHSGRLNDVPNLCLCPSRVTRVTRPPYCETTMLLSSISTTPTGREKPSATKLARPLETSTDTTWPAPRLATSKRPSREKVMPVGVDRFSAIRRTEPSESSAQSM